jgi:hypothetical protein
MESLHQCRAHAGRRSRTHGCSRPSADGRRWHIDGRTADPTQLARQKAASPPARTVAASQRLQQRCHARRQRHTIDVQHHRHQTVVTNRADQIHYAPLAEAILHAGVAGI